MLRSVDALRGARAKLVEAGIAYASREARWMAEAAWGPGTPAAPDRTLGPSEAERFAALVERRLAGEPLAYVTGVAGFRHLLLQVDRRVLIPRPETEGLVELVLHHALGGTVVDIGTGSGCIAIALAREGKYASVTGVDISAESLEVARRNGEDAGARVEWLTGDLCAPLRGRRFDAVVSNPPYLTGPEYAALDPSVRAWEPEGALKSGDDGMAHTRRLLEEARAVTAPGGLLALEVDSRRAGVVARDAEGLGWTDVHTYDDLFGRARYVLARLGATR
jgi:release factor glutamine methyltransferase